MQQLIPQQIEGSPEFSNAPYFFRIQALFPYVQVMGFIQAGLQRGIWKNLNALFDDPPETTRQIYEPQTYYNHQAVSRWSHWPAAGTGRPGRTSILVLKTPWANLAITPCWVN